MRGQLVLQHAVVTLLQLDAGERALHVGADRTRVCVGLGVCQAKNDGVAVAKPERRKKDRKKFKILHVTLP